ncbi:hypothetical protein [Roseicella frigidaeris]|uniref:Uncharacterized protein n=1 Tax=Roseicella frigidaeris TaxID=2230885 RepID=A0A327MG41_9PROT|nr:hypothetical protein [Roseicella frigidaeris]RAI61033.1 hypothetical protein DOO78_02590 [Roseicella frigidaeris]
MRRAPLLAAALLLVAAGPAQDPPLQDTEAFERGFAISLYQFDACGDPLAGRMFRRALAERFEHCPFSPEARSRYQGRTRAELARVRERMQRIVEENGGLPRELAGMSTTCHAQQASAPYRDFRARLERYAEGSLPAEAVIPAACDAADIMP